jgi:hypothetical protein
MIGMMSPNGTFETSTDETWPASAQRIFMIAQYNEPRRIDTALHLIGQCRVGGR